MDINLSLFFISSFFLVWGGIVSFLPMLPKVNTELKKWILKSRFQMRMGVFGLFAVAIFGFFPGDGAFLIGDLLPFIASLILTVLFLLGYIRSTRHLDEASIQRADRILTAIQIPFGIFSFIAGLLHVIFPKWPIL